MQKPIQGLYIVSTDCISAKLGTGLRLPRSGTTILVAVLSLKTCRRYHSEVEGRRLLKSQSNRKMQRKSTRAEVKGKREGGKEIRANDDSVLPP